ncbi:MAG TPA: thioredoxin family protein [Verrucomicrobiae bacterium]|nr:thioredoxin family protein [Verrucomicrobiae bacterium]
MKIQILAAGCAKCKVLTATAEQTAPSLGLKYKLEKVANLKENQARFNSRNGVRAF